MSSFSSEDNSDSTEAVDNVNTALQELQVDEAVSGVRYLDCPTRQCGSSID